MSEYQSKWEQFARLNQTIDSLAREQKGWGRWFQMPYLTFLIPFDDPHVVEQLVEWQQVFESRLHYDPLPPEHLHLTLHQVGFLRLRPWFWLPNLWRRAALPKLVQRVRPVIEDFEPFEIRVGPLNAFPNVLIAEVQDDNRCLHVLRARIRRALPLRARPSARWMYIPHVTLGYWGTQDISPLVDAIQPYRQVEPLTVRVRRVTFTIYSRQHLSLSRNVLRAANEEVIAEFALK